MLSYVQRSLVLTEVLSTLIREGKTLFNSNVVLAATLSRFHNSLSSVKVCLQMLTSVAVIIEMGLSVCSYSNRALSGSFYPLVDHHSGNTQCSIARNLQCKLIIA